ncbi:hypothetical protein DSECCO2_298790 [anaerobic digester metagenome]
MYHLSEAGLPVPEPLMGITAGAHVVKPWPGMDISASTLGGDSGSVTSMITYAEVTVRSMPTFSPLPSLLSMSVSMAAPPRRIPATRMVPQPPGYVSSSMEVTPSDMKKIRASKTCGVRSM